MSERPQEETRDKGGEGKGSPSMRGSKSVTVKKRHTHRGGERRKSDKKRQRREEEEGETVEWTHQSSSLCVQSSVRLAGVLLTLPASANYTRAHTHTHTSKHKHTHVFDLCSLCVCESVCAPGSAVLAVLVW